MRITLLGVLVGMAAALLLVYVVQRVQEANQAKAETNEQSQVNKNTDPDRNRLGCGITPV